ncbi:DNA-(apurinic or apyrimidinic site) lyase [Galendromus occidentalis]|uniref:DNA repair nuclease/redox regulator APEX1 n=1 Tax=Galendromus occidentalis TaxID=34638 RepID=A0AAJ6QUJ8_9ACAR|nr:DNA-(apurinic or apyrimidinic site) lyase [Galendromus occidentalis]
MAPKRAARRAASKTDEPSETVQDSTAEISKKTRSKRSRKDHEEDDLVEEKLSGGKAKKTKKTPKRSKSDNADVDDSSSTDKTRIASSDYGRKGSWKIVTWNVNGIRSWLKNGGLEYIEEEDADVYCLQETKCSEEKLPPEVTNYKGYKSYFLAGDKEGYSGVGIMSRKTPLNVEYGLSLEEHDSEGRVITLEFEEFFLVNSYVPNAGRGLVRLDYRLTWDRDFRKYLVGLKKKKSVILTGDLNVAHNEIDLKNPKTNKKNAGFTEEERQGLTDLLEEGFVDTFRKLYPEREGAYTFWTYMMNARAKNVGWRLDYFIVSEDLIDNVIDNEIRSTVMGSDHCPVVLHLK